MHHQDEGGLTGAAVLLRPDDGGDAEGGPGEFPGRRGHGARSVGHPQANEALPTPVNGGQGMDLGDQGGADRYQEPPFARRLVGEGTSRGHESARERYAKAFRSLIRLTMSGGTNCSQSVLPRRMPSEIRMWSMVTQSRR